MDEEAKPRYRYRIKDPVWGRYVTRHHMTEEEAATRYGERIVERIDASRFVPRPRPGSFSDFCIARETGEGAPGTRVAGPSVLTCTQGADMADDLKQTGKQDDQRINVEQDHELKYWSETLGVSREELREAVQSAGPMVKDVRQHLNR